MLNYDVFIPVRLTSKRFPKKTMSKINGKPILYHLIQRIKTSKKIRKVIVCTTTNNSDDELVKFLNNEGLDVFRGNEHDILVRFLDAAKHYDTDFIVSVDGDDIYADPALVDKILSKFDETNGDYIQILGVPIGFTPFGFKTKSLEKICSLKKTNNTETGYVRFFTETNLFNIKNVEYDLKTSLPQNLRLSLDYPIELEIANYVYGKLGSFFHMEDVLNLLEKNPELLKITDKIESEWNEHWDTNLADISINDN